MPRPRTKQSPLTPAPLIAPGFKGLNTEQETTIGLADSLFALQLDNAVFGKAGHIVTRKGYVDQTTTPISGSPDVLFLHEYRATSGEVQLLGVAADFTFQKSLDDGVTWSDITGSVVTTTALWKFVNFKGDVFAAAPGHRVHKYIGSGDFAEVSGSPVTNGVIMAKFGRVWVGQDGTDTVKFSLLLDGDTWDGTGTGGVDASNAWTADDGTDDIVALGGFGATFVIFGKRNILLYVDGTGSVLAVDPTTMYIVDTIEGTGCISQNSVVSIGEGDLWFQSDQGVQSLARTIKDKVNPLTSVTTNVRTLAQGLQSLQVGSPSTVQAIYSPEDQFVLYLYPESQTVLMFDTQFALQDGTYRVSRWTGLPWFSLLLRRDNTVWVGLGAGNVALHDTFRDDGSAYSLVYTSPHLDFGPEVHNRLKILKQFYGIFLCTDDVTVTVRWATDFGLFNPLTTGFGVEQITVSCPSEGSEWNIAEWAIGEWGLTSPVARTRHYFAGADEGQFIQVQVTLESTTADAIGGIQELSAHARIGRLV